MANREVDLNQFAFDGATASAVPDLRKLAPDVKQRLLMTGVDVSEKGRSGSFLQVDQSNVHCCSMNPDVEVLDIKTALKKYDGLPEYFWKIMDPDKDAFTRSANEKLHGGYFVRTRPGVKVLDPVQACLLLDSNKVGQNVHNVVIVEEGSELHLITGCAVSHEDRSGAHLGISEFYVKKGGKLTFTMIHNWGDKAVVRPRTAGVVEEGGVFQNNYVLLKAVKDLQSCPTITLKGRGARARFNSVIVAPRGSYVDSGSRINLEAPDTAGEIIARTITTGGTIINPGYIGGHAVPARGHLECKGLILGGGVIHAIPELEGTVEGVELSHEAAVGKIAQDEIEYLMARGLDEDEATSTIVRGFLNVDIMGLPAELKKVIDDTIADTEKDMF